MSFKRKANKALALILSLSLAMSTNMPISVLANEAAAPETESAAAEIAYVMSGEDAIGINLNANPVVIQEAVDVSGNTVPGSFNLIYDADRDGVADAGEEKLAIEGETAFDSALNVYGVYNVDTTENILITMESGEVAALYGSCYGDVTSDGDSISIVVNGGTITEMYGITGYDYYTVGRVYIKIGEQAGVENYTVENCERPINYYLDNQGAVEIYGTHTMVADETYKTLAIAGGTFVVPSGVTLTAESISLGGSYSVAIMLLRGNLNTENLSVDNYYGKLLVDGGTLPESLSSVAKFYPFVLTSNIENSSLAPSSSNYYTDYTENGVTTRFLKANQSIGFKYASITGYDCYYSTDGLEYNDAASTFYVTTPQAESLEMELMYVPKQISVENNFSAPKGVVGQTYTADKPLCDLSIYPITNDTTEEYGGEVKYAVKKATPLPAGLSLVKGKIIGTPTKACGDGQKVTIVVTGRNGSTADLELTIKVVEEATGENNINNLVTVGANEIHLNGTSVVIAQGSYSSRAKIYLDADQDKLPDNNIALQIDGDDDLYLGSYRIYGYSNTEEAFDGDISITVKGGALAYLRGVAGTSAEDLAVVNGDVSVTIENVTMNTTSGSIIGAEYGKAENVTVEIRDGAFRYTDIYGVLNSEILYDVNYVFADEVYVTAGSTTYPMMLYAASASKVGEDVNVEIGYVEKSTSYGFQSVTGKTHAKYHGVSTTSVAGDVNYLVEGCWYPDENYLVENSDVTGNVSVQCDDCYIAQTYVATGAKITGDVIFEAQENKAVDTYPVYLLTGSSSANNVKVDVPVSCTGDFTLSTDVSADSTVKNATYINNKGNLKIGGDCTIEEDVDLTGLTILSGTEVEIAQGVTVDLEGSTFNIKEGATLINKGVFNYRCTRYAGATTGYAVAGIFENYGEFNQISTSSDAYFLHIESNGTVINHETGRWNVASRIYNLGKIVNYGSFVQTYTGSSCKKLGTLYTTTPLTLSKAVVDYTNIDASTPYSTLYFAVCAEYPAQCVQEVTLQADAFASSGVTGDENQYIKIDRYTNSVPFTVSLGEQSLNNVNLDKVTYGPNATEAVVDENDALVWNGDAAYIYEPITVTLHYSPTSDVTPITLEKSEDTVTGLAVDQVYTYEQPLYDLTSIAIEGDISAENGKVIYSVETGTLPDGIVLKDGKLYGRLTTATSEMEVGITVQGLNLTTASFTLKFDAVAKAVPEWSAPGALTASVGQTLAEVELPTDERGTYNWPVYKDLTQVLTEAGTVTERIYFDPSDTANYDWTAVSGWDEDDNILVFDISINVEPADAVVTAPTGLAAIYGQTFADIEIPVSEDVEGSFVWDTEHHALTDFVGEVGEHTCYVTYIPTSKNYKTKTGIEVTLTVTPATPTYQETLTEVTLFCDETLGDVLLPDVDGGRYQWVSATSIEPEDGETYSVIYLPEDTVNYDWSSVDGWHKYRKGVVFSVQVTIEHAWGEGVVTKPATEKEEGEKTYSCGLCDAMRTETIPKLPNTGGESDGPVAPPSDPGTPQPPKVGYTLSDSGSKAVYKVSKVGAEVTYVKPDKKTYTKVKVPKTVKYEGVTYKVTAIANNAFKNNTKMTKVTIGANVKMIGNSAFQGCTSLKSITIPKNVTKIGKKAFFGCKKLMKMTIKTTKLTEKSVGKKAFTKMGSSNYKKVVVKVPKKQKKVYTKWLKKRGLSKKAKVK